MKRSLRTGTNNVTSNVTGRVPSPVSVPLQEIKESGRARVGSVQTMYEYSEGDKSYLLSEAPDDGSVFDVGTIFSIPGSGAARNTFRHKIYTRLMNPISWEQLSRRSFEACYSDPSEVDRIMGTRTFKELILEGAKTHHIGLVDRSTGAVIAGETDSSSDMVLMECFPVVKPARAFIAGTPVYDYANSGSETSRLVALEHIVRRGNPGGSSLQARFDLLNGKSEGDAAAFAARFGAGYPLVPWQILPNLKLEWSSKYEGYDRYLSVQEALLISGVSAEIFQHAVELLELATVQVVEFLAPSGLTLWDLKYELAVSEGSMIVIVDTLDHDSMRLTFDFESSVVGPCRVHFNKQAVRDYYRIFHSDWHSSLAEIKALSDQPGSPPFKVLLWDGVKSGRYQRPPNIDGDFAMIQSRKYHFVTSCGEPDSSEARLLAEDEISFYKLHGKLDRFMQFNCVSA